jgi:hypothetical protein
MEVLDLDHDNERFVDITNALTNKLTEAFELAMVFETELVAPPYYERVHIE